MKDKEKWKPSKFTHRNGKLMASRNPDDVAVSSRLSADIVASYYDTYIGRYACGKLLARRKKSGRPVGAMDAIIAATADVHGFTVATRNVDDFDFISNRVVDPWTVSTLPE